MNRMRIVLAAGAILAGLPIAAHAAPQTAEALTGQITPQTARRLSCLVDRNADKLVKVDLKIEWPEAQVETTSGDLVFWDKKPAPNGEQFLFKKGSYAREGKGYAVKGYFVVRYGGMHQGITGYAFEPPAQPVAGDVTEVAFRGTNCS